MLVIQRDIMGWQLSYCLIASIALRESEYITKLVAWWSDIIERASAIDMNSAVNMEVIGCSRCESCLPRHTAAHPTI